MAKIEIRKQLCDFGDYGYFLIIAWNNGIKGSCILEVCEHSTWFSSLYVNKNERWNGIEGKLLEEAERITKNDVTPKLKAISMTCEENLIPFYEGLGYFISDSKTRIVMTKWLR
jgi:GNAT superfamily N-acetyltransferase